MSSSEKMISSLGVIERLVETPKLPNDIEEIVSLHGTVRWVSDYLMAMNSDAVHAADHVVETFDTTGSFEKKKLKLKPRVIPTTSGWAFVAELTRSYVGVAEKSAENTLSLDRLTGGKLAIHHLDLKKSLTEDQKFFKLNNMDSSMLNGVLKDANESTASIPFDLDVDDIYHTSDAYTLARDIKFFGKGLLGMIVSKPIKAEDD